MLAVMFSAGMGDGLVKRLVVQRTSPDMKPEMLVRGKLFCEALVSRHPVVKKRRRSLFPVLLVPPWCALYI
jgi:hypothetical protein